MIEQGNISSQAPIVIFHKEHPIHPTLPNGGAETASLALARQYVKLGRRVFLAAVLPDDFLARLNPETKKFEDGVCYLNLGESFDTAAAFGELREGFGLKAYHLIVASRAQALLESREFPEILTRHFIDHEQSPDALGMDPTIIGMVADHLICVSHSQRQSLLSAGCNPDNTVVVYNGVDPEIFQPADPMYRDYNRIIFVGALVVDKGVHLLVEAFAKLKTTHPALRLDVYGSAQLWGRDNYFDIEAVQAQVPDLTFHGAVAQSTIAEALKKSGLLVVPSIIFDPFNMVAAEGQACGLPVLASANGGMKEFVDHNVTGRIFTELTSDAIAGEIEYLIDRPERLQGLSANAVRISPEKFSWTKTAKQIEELMAKSSSIESKLD